MKYGCAKDTNLSYSNVNSSPTNESYDSENYDITSSFNLEVSDASHLSYVDHAVRDIMFNNSFENTMGSEKGSNKIMKFIINCLHEQVTSMKEEIVFLRADAKCKNSTIGSLFRELSMGQNYRKDPLLDSSGELSGIMKKCSNSLFQPEISASITPSVDSDKNYSRVNANGIKFHSIADQLAAVRNDHQFEFYGCTSSKHLPPDYEKNFIHIPDEDAHQHCDDKGECNNKEEGTTENTENEDDYLQHIGDWVKHSNNFATNEMKKWGYQGGGLGREGNGIKEPINVEKRTFKSHTEQTITLPPWPQKTVLIAGSSMINQLDETKMSKQFNVKVRANNGATATDMIDHLNAFLRKKTDHLILHVGSNDMSDKNSTAEIVFSQLLRLKSFAEYKVPGIKVIISCPTERSDDMAANQKIMDMRKILISSGLHVIPNDNISKVHLGKKGLHLNQYGVKRLAMNMIACIRRL